ncbi:hypothetical protein QE152_g1197 [Popillia japonica]|uniref:Integrase zinc-binding domain-containing protein n=1 Tax=Popillia japonica TaxID=7064 RepID=A0AAW1N3G4_POPJA
MNKKCTRVARWALLLEKFDYIIEHRPESRMKHCDALSRNPIALIVRNEFLEKVKVAQKEDEHLKARLLQKQPYNDYEMDKDILYKQKNGLRLLVAPTNMQRQIITKAHEHGHFAVKKTKDLIMRERLKKQRT